jgi:magnesium transporter
MDPAHDSILFKATRIDRDLPLWVHCWINIEPPFSDELEELSDRLNIPLDFFTDPLDIDERSRYERRIGQAYCHEFAHSQ